MVTGELTRNFARNSPLQRKFDALFQVDFLLQDLLRPVRWLRRHCVSLRLQLQMHTIEQ